jgi:multiple sugar transport system substrate-binding protein
VTRRSFRVAVRKFDPFESAIRKQWDTFDASERTGLSLDAVPMDLPPLSECVFESGGLERGDWDVVFLNTDWVASAHRQGCLSDLAPRILSDPPGGFPDAWPPSLLRLQEIDGHVLGLPYHDGPECLIYRTDLLEDPAEQAAYESRFGAPLRVPETWDEFLQVARHFHRPEQRRYGTVFAAYPDGHNTVYDFCLQLWSRGGELTGADGKITLGSGAAHEALRFLRETINDSTIVHPGCREMDSVKSGLAFAAGEAALMVNWFGFASMAQTIASSAVKGKVGIAPVPHAEGCQGPSLNIYWILGIAAGTPHPDVAWRFLKYCASREMDRLLTLEGGIGCRRSTWTDNEVNRTIPFYQRMEELHACARELPRMPEWPHIAGIIDRMVIAAIDSPEPIANILASAQESLDARRTGS